MERELIERLKRPMTMSMYSRMGELAAAALAERKMAADLIESLRAQLDEARKALEPFGQMAEVYDGNEDTDPVLAVLHKGVRINLTVGDLRRAAAIRNMGGEG